MKSINSKLLRKLLFLGAFCGVTVCCSCSTKGKAFPETAPPRLTDSSCLVNTAVRTYGHKKLLQEVKRMLIEELLKKDGVCVADSLPQYIIHISLTKLRLVSPGETPLGIAMSVVISQPAENLALWKNRKSFGKEVEKEILFSLHQQEILIQHWQRGGDMSKLSSIVKSVADDFDQELLLKARSERQEKAAE